MENKIILYNLMEDKVAGYIIGDYTVLKGESILHRIEGGHDREYHIDSSIPLVLGNDVFYILSIYPVGDWKYEEYITIMSDNYYHKRVVNKDFKNEMLNKKRRVIQNVHKEFIGNSESLLGLVRDYKIKNIIDSDT